MFLSAEHVIPISSLRWRYKHRWNALYAIAFICFRTIFCGHTYLDTYVVSVPSGSYRLYTAESTLLWVAAHLQPPHTKSLTTHFCMVKENQKQSPQLQFDKCGHHVTACGTTVTGTGL